MDVIATIVLLGLFSFSQADALSQRDYGLCSEIYTMYQYCTSQLSPAFTSLSHPDSQTSDVGGFRDPRGIVNYTAIDEKIDKKFFDWEERMEEKFLALKKSDAKKMQEMEDVIANKSKDLQMREKELIEWKNSVDSEMKKMRFGIANETDELQGMKDELVEQKVSLQSEMTLMKAGIANKTREYEERTQENFSRWRNSAESDVEEMKTNLTRKGNECEVRSMRENFTRWKNSTESEMQEMKASLTKNENEIRTLKKFLRIFNNCENAGAVIEGNGGVVTIEQNGKFYEVYCDMATDGGNWTVFQRRVDGSVDFYRNWEEYASGFGNKNGEFWLGLETIYQLTQDGEYELRVDLTDWDGSKAYAKYRNFSLAGRTDGYRLTVGGYSGTARDSMGDHNGERFSAKDKDLDTWVTGSCATRSHAAWWFYSCGHCSLNGRYNDTSDYWTGVFWQYSRDRFHYSLKSSEMKFRKR